MTVALSFFLFLGTLVVAETIATQLERIAKALDSIAATAKAREARRDPSDEQRADGRSST
jgi:hypothetical protein